MVHDIVYSVLVSAKVNVFTIWEWAKYLCVSGNGIFVSSPEEEKLARERAVWGPMLGFTAVWGPMLGFTAVWGPWLGLNPVLHPYLHASNIKT